jgi:hypothetical protein
MPSNADRAALLREAAAHIEDYVAQYRSQEPEADNALSAQLFARLRAEADAVEADGVDAFPLRLGFAVWEVDSPCFAEEELNGNGPIYTDREEAEDYIGHLENDVDGSPRGSYEIVAVYAARRAEVPDAE